MRLIDADAYQFSGDLIDEPTIDAEPVRHGHWVDGFDADGVLVDYDCSLCNMANDEKTDYCPNCGAKMDEN